MIDRALKDSPDFTEIMTSHWQLGLFAEHGDEAGSALHRCEPVAYECDDAAFEQSDVHGDDPAAMGEQAVPDHRQLALHLFAELA